MEKNTTTASAVGFSLIELLVIIAIIAILSALFVPSLRRPRDSALQAACASQLKQVMTAMNFYLGDHNAKYPPSELNWNDSNGQQQVVDWTDELGSYDGRNLTQAQKQQRWFKRDKRIAATVLYECPAETIALYYVNVTEPRDHYERTYRINGARRAFDPADQKPWGIAHNQHSVHATDVYQPAQTILITERRAVNHPVGYVFGFVQSPDQQLEWGTPLHSMGTSWNYLFADGHVQILQPRKTYGTGSMATPAGLWTRRVGD